jgi:hypothetical protein
MAHPVLFLHFIPPTILCDAKYWRCEAKEKNVNFPHIAILEKDLQILEFIYEGILKMLN